MKNFATIVQNIGSSSKKVIALTVDGDQIPEVFFTQLIHHAFSLQKIPYEKVTITKENSEEFKRKLQTQFLGSNSIFWITNYYALPPKEKKEWYGYISHYRGPHTLFLISKEKEVAADWVACSFPSRVDRSFFCELTHYYTVEDEAASKRFVEKIFKRYRALSLDQALMLVQYVQLLGPRTDDFVNDWMHNIVKNESSLFTLSEFFLLKKKESFFAYWYPIKDHYSEQFWISFWSELCWRAALFVYYMQKQDMLQAKKAAFRLPYKLINYGWKQSSVEQLIEAHHSIYHMDFLIKNGSASSFELFFLTFFDTTHAHRIR